MGINMIVPCLIALAIGFVIGKIAGMSMPSIGLSWTWTAVALLCAVVVLPSWHAPVEMEIFTVTASLVALMTYVSAEVRGQRERHKQLRTPRAALEDRRGRVLVTAVVLPTVLHDITVKGVVLSTLGLAIMWCYGERKALVQLLLPRLEPVMARSESDLGGRLEIAVHHLTERIKRR